MPDPPKVTLWACSRCAAVAQEVHLILKKILVSMVEMQTHACLSREAQMVL